MKTFDDKSEGCSQNISFWPYHLEVKFEISMY